MANPRETNQASLHAGMTIPFFKKIGTGSPSPVSALALNLLVRILRALVNMEIVLGQDSQPKILWSDRKVMIVIPAQSTNTTSNSTSGMNYKGEYVSTSTYNFGDVVKVTTGSNQGIFVCISSSPITGQAPSTPSGNANWDIFNLGIAQFAGCAGGASHNFYTPMQET